MNIVDEKRDDRRLLRRRADKANAVDARDRIRKEVEEIFFIVGDLLSSDAFDIFDRRGKTVGHRGKIR